MKLTLKHHFDAAHRLEFHRGLCRNLHGHRWEVLIEIEQKKVEDMIIDFGDLKEIINQYDHSCLLKDCDDNRYLIQVLEVVGMKMITLDSSPTAENLIKKIYEDIEKKLLLKAKIKITLWESPGAGISYEGK